jgi:hypothetical protein
MVTGLPRIMPACGSIGRLALMLSTTIVVVNNNLSLKRAKR